MSKLVNNNNIKINEIKTSIEKFLSETSQSNKDIFSYQEIEDILLDIYNLAVGEKV